MLAPSAAAMPTTEATVSAAIAAMSTTGSDVSDTTTTAVSITAATVTIAATKVSITAAIAIAAAPTAAIPSADHHTPVGIGATIGVRIVAAIIGISHVRCWSHIAVRHSNANSDCYLCARFRGRSQRNHHYQTE